jgi:hypothetical protein
LVWNGPCRHLRPTTAFRPHQTSSNHLDLEKHINIMEKNKLDKRTKRWVFMLFLLAAGFYIGFIALTAISG